MEYLVTMTTSVPDGTPDETVEQVRAREASRSRELAAQQHLLRLWRPPLRPGEWRTLGLFAAADGTELEQVLASMPLRVWRTDEVTAAVTASQRPGPATPAGRCRVPHHVYDHDPAGHSRPGRHGRRDACGAAGEGTGRAGTPAPAVGAARTGTHAGLVAGRGPGRNAGDRGVTAAGSLDDHGHHAAGPAPERPGQRRKPVLSAKDQRVAVNAGGSQVMLHRGCRVGWCQRRMGPTRWGSEVEAIPSFAHPSPQPLDVSTAQRSLPLAQRAANYEAARRSLGRGEQETAGQRRPDQGEGRESQ